MKIQVLCDFCDTKTTIQVRVPFYENLNNLPARWAIINFLVRTKKSKHEPLVACPKCAKEIGKYLTQKMRPQLPKVIRKRGKKS